MVPKVISLPTQDSFFYSWGKRQLLKSINAHLELTIMFRNLSKYSYSATFFFQLILRAIGLVNGSLQGILAVNYTAIVFRWKNILNI